MIKITMIDNCNYWQFIYYCKFCKTHQNAQSHVKNNTWLKQFPVTPPTSQMTPRLRTYGSRCLPHTVTHCWNSKEAVRPVFPPPPVSFFPAEKQKALCGWPFPACGGWNWMIAHCVSGQVTGGGTLQLGGWKFFWSSRGLLLRSKSFLKP